MGRNDKKKAAAKASKAKGKAPSKSAGEETTSPSNNNPELKISSRSVTGVLQSRPESRDILIDQVTLIYHGKPLLMDTVLELNHGNRYGLIGTNGCGKSTLLTTIGERELPIPKGIDIFHVHKEVDKGEETAVQSVVRQAQLEADRLEAEAERMMVEEPDSPQLQEMYDRLEELDPATFQARAADVLTGLGFDSTMMNKRTADLSGGWRMRVALAQALFVKPLLLLLDEPTNHLDLKACVWLEDYIAKYPHTVLLVSHSQDFLNGVCTHTLHMRQRKLTYYGGNYDTFCKTRLELEINQMKAFKKQQADIEHLQNFIRSCGTYANLVRQAKSKQKIIDKMSAAGLVEAVTQDPIWMLEFDDPGELPPPVMAFDKVGFSYSGKREDELYSNISFGVDLDSRIALVGPNGAGKSTLLKMMLGLLEPTRGEVRKHSHLRISRYNQHTEEALDLELSPIEFMMKKYPERKMGGQKMEEQQWRSVIGKYGLTGEEQSFPIGNLSDGQRTRLAFMLICIERPHLLLLDEPTNHLDIDSIDSLAEAINNFKGGLILVSHDFRLINQVAKEIWEVDKKTIKVFQGDIQKYKKTLRHD